MQPYPYSNPNYRGQYINNQLGQQAYFGQYGNTNLARYTQNPNVNFPQTSNNSTKPVAVSIKKPAKKVESSSEDEEEKSKEDDEISISDENDEKSKSSEGDSESNKESESESSGKDEDEEAKSSPRKKSHGSESESENSDKKSDDSERDGEESEDDDKKSVDESKPSEIKIYPEIQERVKVFRNIVHELDDLEKYLKKKFQYFPNENSEDVISDRFTRK